MPSGRLGIQLGDKTASAAAGTPVRLSEPKDGAEQRWRFEEGKFAHPASGDVIRDYSHWALSDSLSTFGCTFLHRHSQCHGHRRHRARPMGSSSSTFGVLSAQIHSF